MREESIFVGALDLVTPAERSAYLDLACAGEPALRRRVEALLLAHEQSGDMLDPPAVPRPVAEGPGTRIGPYKLLQSIGEGGMGVVFMAEQESPVRRRVALKVIKPGMDSAPSSPDSRPSARPWRSWTTTISPRSSTPARPTPAGRSSSWNWCTASRSPSTATATA